MALNIQLMMNAEYEIDGNVLTVHSEHRTTVYRLPVRKTRVAVERVSTHRSRLVIGGFNTTLVTVTGPTVDIHRLMDAVS